MKTADQNETARARAAKARVFIVEDHAATARGLKMFLELSGYAVELADSMRAALTAAKQIQFDVVVCDLNLPDGSGWELMERLRKNGPVRGIAYSAYNEAQHVARSREAGFVEHIVKGSTPEELVAAIGRAMAGRAPRA